MAYDGAPTDLSRRDRTDVSEVAAVVILAGPRLVPARRGARDVLI